jgi:hypothetical protein
VSAGCSRLVLVPLLSRRFHLTNNTSVTIGALRQENSDEQEKEGRGEVDKDMEIDET